ncbi:MAG TPA: TetR family transcriptional regulator [Actinomycetota bacterium]|nr:TetR family transcriptional regulator [Actinomycetota bacterium]
MTEAKEHRTEENGPPEPESLTEKQSARRRRVLDAAMDLASEGGYEAVQMRDVAARADVALGTLYRYFSSKDQLLAAVRADWTSALERRLGRQPLEGASRAERVIDFLTRATRPLEKRPRLAEALVLSVATRDPHASAYQREVSSWMDRIVVDALCDLPDEDAHGIREVLGHVWNSVLLAWVNGHIEPERMYDILRSACHLLLDPRET